MRYVESNLMPAQYEPLRLAFLGCGFITEVHSRNLRRLRTDIVASYASRDARKAESLLPASSRRTEFRGLPRGNRGSARRCGRGRRAPALSSRAHAGRRSTPASTCSSKSRPFSRMDDYNAVVAARDRVQRVVLVGENDHYKPLAVRLRQLLADGIIGDMIFAHFTTIAERLKSADDWRNDEALAGGDAFFEEGIHWLHIAGSLGPKITAIHGYRPSRPR